jgi:hypothetical protein
MVFIAKESIAHKTAKDTLAQWLRDAPEKGNDDYWVYPIRSGDPLMWRPNWGEPVFVEYPFAADGYVADAWWVLSQVAQPESLLLAIADYRQNLVEAHRSRSQDTRRPVVLQVCQACGRVQWDYRLWRSN